MPKAAVITGASSGIGRASVIRMARAGWRVFAGVRKASDMERLRSEPGVLPILMDMEDEASIRAAAENVATELRGEQLDALVNVAGVGMVRPVQYASLSGLRKIFEINVFGQIAVTQAFLPLFQSGGRIVNMTSVGVNIAIPFGGPLNASKSAFAMLSDSLRLELHAFGIRVIAIEPGSISTPAVDKTLGVIEEVIADLPPEGRVKYGPLLRKTAQMAYTMEKKGSSPQVVADAVHHALTSSRPRLRYRVGKHAKLLATLPKILPEALLDALRIRMFGLSAASTSKMRRRPPARVVTSKNPQ